VRGKTAKVLRRQARATTIDMPIRRLVVKKHGKMIVVDGKPERYASIQVFNDPNSTRGVYRMLKKGIIA
jgi:hypothetical protein